MHIQKISLKDYSSLRIGGEADMITVTTEDELKEAMLYAEQEKLRVHILGSGTNTFFAEYIESTLFVKIEIQGKEEIRNPDNDSEVLLTVGAGEIWDDTVLYCVERGLWGIENLSYIPGTVGAAPVQNIGAYGVELKDVVYEVRVYDRVKDLFSVLPTDECEFTYRDSFFKKEKGRYCISSVTLRLSKVAKPILTYKPLDMLLQKEEISIQEIRDIVVATRQAKLPDWHIYPNAGSFFKNPIITEGVFRRLVEMYPTVPFYTEESRYKIPAAWLIEHIAEMKGVRIDDVGTWPSQPLVIVNYGNTTVQGLLAFSDNIIAKVEAKTSIMLEKEVQYVK
jgi:UDP-N-acetylmuramate dehydrogenase